MRSSDHKTRSRFLKRRLFWLMCIGCLFVGAAFFYLYFWLHRPIGNGPAGLSVPLTAFRSNWSNQKVLLVGIGDSVTAGFGSSARHSYFDRLVNNPEDEFSDMQGRCLSRVLPGLEHRNLAVSGSTSIEHLVFHLSKLETQQGDVFGIVVVTTGGNDIIHNYGRSPPREGAMYGATYEQAIPWINNFSTRLEKILSRIQEKFPGGCEIFLANIYDPTDGIGDIVNAGLPSWPDGLRVLSAYNEIIDSATQKRENVHLVNMHDHFLGHGIHCLQFWRRNYQTQDPHYWYSDNLEDPNDRGYDAIRRLFLIEMMKSLPQILND